MGGSKAQVAIAALRGIAESRAGPRGGAEHGGPEVVRALEDGPFVVLHGRGGGRVFFEVFRFEGDRPVERWSFSEPEASPNGSGRTQTDGPFAPRPGEDVESNKALVRDYHRTVDLDGRHDAVRRYLGVDVQLRHEPGVRDGVAAFEADLARLTASRTIDEVMLLAGHGDIAFIAARGTHEGRPCAYADLYRVEGGRLVEHWGFPQEISSWKDCRVGTGVP